MRLLYFYALNNMQVEVRRHDEKKNKNENENQKRKKR